MKLVANFKKDLLRGKAAEVIVFRPPKRSDSKLGTQKLIFDEHSIKLYNSHDWGFVKQGKHKLRLFCVELNDYFHRVLLGAKLGEYVDHINRNPLDNRFCNLRILSKQENCFNTDSHRDSKYSDYKGVSYCSNPAGRKKRWVAQIKVGDIRKKEYLLTEKEAALKYNEWAKKLQGDYCVLNKICTWESDLKFGNEAEEYFYLKFRDKLEKTDGLKCDLKIITTGEGIQLKTDRRPNDTGNIFIEKYSHKLKKTPGGPWKAELDGSVYFIYFFRKTEEFYTYRNIDLINFIVENEDKLRYHEVKSTKSNASGFIVPLNSIRHLELNFEEILK